MCLTDNINTGGLPHGDTADFPFPPNGMIVSGVDMIIKELEKLICTAGSVPGVWIVENISSRTRLFLLELCDTGDEARVDVQRFQPGHRMCSHCRMMCIDL